MALQLRNRISAFTELQLAPTIALDHPTPAALTAHIEEMLGRPESGGKTARGARHDTGADRRGLPGPDYPGFGDDKAIPRDVETLVRTFADPVRALVGDRPLVLLGHCAGGLVAHALATHLAETGTASAGVALIESDIGLVDGADPRTLALLSAEKRVPTELSEDHFADVTAPAGGWYARIFMHWYPEPSPVPTLLVCGGPTPEMTEADPARSWRPRWPMPHEAVDVPGDHDTMLTDHADTTAAVIDAWIASVLHAHSQLGPAESSASSFDVTDDEPG